MTDQTSFPFRAEPSLTATSAGSMGWGSTPPLSANLSGGATPGPGERPDPLIRIAPAQIYTDLTTIISSAAILFLVTTAILMGNTKASFIDLPSILIVFGGTLAVTAMGHTGRELIRAWPIITGSVRRRIYDPARVAHEVLDLAVLARKRGLLALGMHGAELEKHPFLHDAAQMVADGLGVSEVDRLLTQDIDQTLDDYRRATGMLRRGSEVAPAMGLVGTLVGLVQMLVSLDNPAAIGPAMALALLTTFYGALLGSIFLNPLAGKLERNANDEALIKTLIHAGMLSIVAQENPRKLEMELNSLLPPDRRVRYFEG